MRMPLIQGINHLICITLGTVSFAIASANAENLDIINKHYNIQTILQYKFENLKPLFS